VLGCLIEKRWTTPDQYPLSLNALRLACNQSTNRDPVTAYDEATVREAAQRLCHYGLARLASGHSSRAIKYRHLAEEALGLEREQLAILCVLLLRGPQTPGELKSRSERMAPLPSLAEVERVLGDLGELGYVGRLDRRPGQKEDRFEHLLGAAASAEPETDAPAPQALTGAGAPQALTAAGAPQALTAAGAPKALTGAGAPEAQTAAVLARPPRYEAPRQPPSPTDRAGLEARVSALESEVQRLRAALDELRAGQPEPQVGSASPIR
jgi:uncharacterized protein YceH (UPF0502 family)